MTNHEFAEPARYTHTHGFVRCDLHGCYTEDRPHCAVCGAPAEHGNHGRNQASAGDLFAAAALTDALHAAEAERDRYEAAHACAANLWAGEVAKVAEQRARADEAEAKLAQVRELADDLDHDHEAMWADGTPRICPPCAVLAILDADPRPVAQPAQEPAEPCLNCGSTLSEHVQPDGSLSCRPHHQRAVVAPPAVMSLKWSVLCELLDEIDAWEMEGLGTCPGIENTNYPDMWASVTEKAHAVRRAAGRARERGDNDGR